MNKFNFSILSMFSVHFVEIQNIRMVIAVKPVSDYALEIEDCKLKIRIWLNGLVQFQFSIIKYVLNAFYRSIEYSNDIIAVKLVSDYTLEIANWRLKFD